MFFTPMLLLLQYFCQHC